jgi:hypothetical protein
MPLGGSQTLSNYNAASFKPSTVALRARGAPDSD